jgi:hypothetical protein
MGKSGKDVARARRRGNLYRRRVWQAGAQRRGRWAIVLGSWESGEQGCTPKPDYVPRRQAQRAVPPRSARSSPVAGSFARRAWEPATSSATRSAEAGPRQRQATTSVVLTVFFSFSQYFPLNFVSIFFDRPFMTKFFVDKSTSPASSINHFFTKSTSTCSWRYSSKFFHNQIDLNRL